MTDTLLTISGAGLYIPFIVQLFRTRWDKTTWPRQLLLLIIAFELTTLLHVPSVMFCGSGLLLAAFIVYCIRMRPPFRFTPLLVLAVVYVVYFAVAVSWSALPLRGLQFLIDNGLPILIFFSAASFIQISGQELGNILKLFCQGALVFAGLVLLSWGISCIELHILPWEWPMVRKVQIGGINAFIWLFRFNGGLNGYTHPSYNLLPLFAASCAAMRLSYQRLTHPAFGWVLWAGGTFISVLAQSRMGLIYSIIIFVAGIVYNMPTTRKRIIAGLSVLALGILLFFAARPTWQQYSQDQIRDDLYTRTWKYIQIKPWTGAGTGALNPIEICHTTKELYWPHIGYIDPDKDVHDWRWKTRMLPHNEWLADWAHAGLPAALITLMFYLYITGRYMRIRSYWGIVFMLIFIILSFLEPPLYIGKGLYLFCMQALLLQSFTGETP